MTETTSVVEAERFMSLVVSGPIELRLRNAEEMRHICPRRSCAGAREERHAVRSRPRHHRHLRTLTRPPEARSLLVPRFTRTAAARAQERTSPFRGVTAPLLIPTPLAPVLNGAVHQDGGRRDEETADAPAEQSLDIRQSGMFLPRG